MAPLCKGGWQTGGSAEPPQHIYHTTGPICRQEVFVQVAQVCSFIQFYFMDFIQSSILHFLSFGCTIKVQKRSESNVLTGIQTNEREVTQ